MTLDRGRKNNQLLIQPQYSPMPVGEQIAILYCGTKGLMSAVPVSKVRECQDSFLEAMRNQHQDVLDFLGSGKIDDAATAVIADTIANVS
jgi:F-type H+-transporting ATPase subunit alpha